MPDVINFLGHEVCRVVTHYYAAAWAVWTTPLLWGLIAVVFLWERWRPAQPEQSLFSGGLGQDFLWFNLHLLLTVTLLPLLGSGVRLFCDAITGGTPPIVSGWPLALKAVAGLLIGDLLFYSKHWLTHKVPFLWHFHAIHHSQREMNLFSDRRQHICEHALTQLLVILPLTMLGLTAYPIMTLGAAMGVHTLLIHANIRSNFGWLGWLLVSPQYHRVHHSIERPHFDKNFGAVITLWDRLFGTHYPGLDEYPPTGVKDVDFDPPASWSPQAWLLDLGGQLWYPFAKLLGRC
jgi:sterol desaturase/sphingolipid hydroxylase (fatty acid hydroxylase superfamily)